MPESRIREPAAAEAGRGSFIGGAGSTTDASVELMRLINAYQLSQALHVAASLGVADHLKDGPQTSDTLAQACGADPGSLYRLMRALAAVGIFHEAKGQRFSLTTLGACLTGDAPGSRRDYARWIGTPGMWQSWGNLLHSVRTGEGAAEFTAGVDAWTYRDQHPEERAVFDAAMTALSRAEAQAVIEAYDFGRFGCIVDIGGGEGQLLTAILLACPGAEGILFDQPKVAASAKRVLSSAGLGQRCEAVGGDFFESVPGGGDAYVMKSVLHDWDNAAAARILRSCRRAMPPGASLLAIERLVGPPNEDPSGKFFDLNMLVQYGAQERTREEFQALLRIGGFDLIDVVTTRSALSIIVATPSPAE
ncbi:methyltransferase [Roseomonas rosulenta]|uniref:methyltransferase n=1 Tax=Roseomonas rosulenta TaxID=2748667 RepID=UPI0018DF4DA8|nr:methyltransferase [Roseomonas rosulenta]